MRRAMIPSAVDGYKNPGVVLLPPLPRHAGMAGRNEVIRSSLEDLLQEFARQPLEKKYFHAYVMRCMQIACGFKVLYETVVGRPHTDQEFEDELGELDHHRFTTVTKEQVEEFCVGTTIHRDVQAVMDAFEPYTRHHKSPADYEREINELRARHAEEIHNIQRPQVPAGGPIPDLNALVNPIMEKIREQDRFIRDLGRSMQDIPTLLQNMNDIRTHMGRVDQLERDLRAQLAVLNRLAQDPSSALTPETREVLSTIVRDHGGHADAPRADFPSPELQQQLNELNRNLENATSRSEQLVSCSQEFLVPLIETLTLCVASNKIQKTDTDGNIQYTMLPDIKTSLDSLDQKCRNSEDFPGPLSKRTFQAKLRPGNRFHENMEQYLELLGKYTMKWSGFQEHDTHKTPILNRPDTNLPCVFFLIAQMSRCCLPPKVFPVCISTQLEYFEGFASASRYELSILSKREHSTHLSGLFFDIGERKIRPCMPDLNHSVVFLMCTSFLNLLINSARQQTIQSLYKRFLGRTITENGERFTVPQREKAMFLVKLMDVLTPIESSIELSIELSPDMSQQDVMCFVYLSDLYFLQSIGTDTHLAYTDSHTQEFTVVNVSQGSGLIPNLKQMFYNMSPSNKPATHVDMNIDPYYRELLQKVGFADAVIARATTLPAI